MLGEFFDMKLRYVSWEEFQLAVDRIERPDGDNLCPIPRGGFVLAVILSHKFNIPMVLTPNHRSVLIDDIADSGRTLSDWKDKYGDLNTIVLFRRASCSPIGIVAAEIIMGNEWVVFPWENKEKAQEDYERYITRK